MSEEPIRRYADATREYDFAYSEVRRLGQITADVSRYLNNMPYDLSIRGVEVRLPAEMTIERKEYTLNADHWPDACRIAEALATLYAKREQVQAIWASLSPPDRTHVNPPHTE